MGKQVEISKRRVLGVLVVVGLASAAVGVGTFAAFSDTEQSTDNSISTGTLNLTVNEGSADVNVLSVDNAEPGQTYNGSAITLANDGSLNGTLNISVASVNTSENGMVDPESEVDNSPNSAEIAGNVTVQVEYGGSQVYNGTIANLKNASQIHTSSLNAGSSQPFNMTYSVADVGNAIQSDSASVDFEFELTS